MGDHPCVGVIEEAEAALVAQWSLLGRAPGCKLHERDGVRWFETPIPSLPYNGVVRTWLADGPEADAVIARVLGRFRSRGVQHLWFVAPSSTPAELGPRLAAQGLQEIERMTYMSFELVSWNAPPLRGEATFSEVLDDDDLRIYNSLTVDYWELSEAEEELVYELQRSLGPGRVPGHRYLARIDGTPVGKAYLSLAGTPGVASFYGMSVQPAARGRGIARDLTLTLLGRAQREGCHRVVIHSSTAGLDLYRRMGFAEHCVLPVHASTQLWAGAH
jgi:ribosomal protein S18 acetylase RimI-like enzyme